MRATWNVILAGALAATAGCGVIPEQVPILSAKVGGDGRTLDLEVGGCNARHTVKVEELSPDEVTLTATARGADGNDCAGQTIFVLPEELGDRTLVDGFSGDVVGVVE